MFQEVFACSHITAPVRFTWRSSDNDTPLTPSFQFDSGVTMTMAPPIHSRSHWLLSTFGQQSECPAVGFNDSSVRMGNHCFAIHTSSCKLGHTSLQMCSHGKLRHRSDAVSSSLSMHLLSLAVRHPGRCGCTIGALRFPQACRSPAFSFCSCSSRTPATGHDSVAIPPILHVPTIRRTSTSST